MDSQVAGDLLGGDLKNVGRKDTRQRNEDTSSTIPADHNSNDREQINPCILSLRCELFYLSDGSMTIRRRRFEPNSTMLYYERNCLLMIVGRAAPSLSVNTLRFITISTSDTEHSANLVSKPSVRTGHFRKRTEACNHSSCTKNDKHPLQCLESRNKIQIAKAE